MFRRERTKEFFRIVQGQGVFRTRFDLVAGAVGAFTVQFEVWTGDRWRPAVRHDSAHGRPHRDTLDWDGNVVEKRWLDPDLAPSDALTLGERDLVVNAATDRESFMERRP